MRILSTRSRVPWLAIISALLISNSAFSLDSAQWQEDLEFVVEKLSTRHADPWNRVHKREFESQVRMLGSQLHNLDDSAITLELMRIVASFEDGHTKLLPTGAQGFKHWFPLRMHWFSDGIYLTSIPKEESHLRGLKVSRINGMDAMVVMDQVTRVFGADNRFARKAFAFLASNADLLQALGIVGAEQVLELELTNDAKNPVRQSFNADVVNESMEFRFWGEMFGPGGAGSISAWGGPALDFLEQADTARPLHLRQRNAYYWEYLHENNTVYFQLNFMTHQSSRAELDIMQTWSNALAASRAGDQPADRFILDLRYNFGGDGSIARSLVSQLLRGYPRALEPGRVFVVTSGITFSAGVMMAEELLDHIPAVLVGEPMGAPWNSYGDAESFNLPNSGYQLDISRRYWQLAESDDARQFIPVRVPAQMSGADYFSGSDPVLNHILSSPAPYPTLDRVLVEQGAESAERTYHERVGQWGELDYWLPVGRMDLEHAADQLIAADRLDDAMAAYRINTWVFPDDWDTWDDLGDVCLEAGLDDCVLDAYSRALELNPSNWNSNHQKQAIREISGAR